MSSIFNDLNETTPRAVGIEPVDWGAAGGFVALVVGLGMVWLPLALIVPGCLVFGVCLWRILR